MSRTSRGRGNRWPALADKGVETTVIDDAAALAVMPRAIQVVLSARGVQDGAALCPAGNRAVAVRWPPGTRDRARGHAPISPSGRTTRSTTPTSPSRRRRLRVAALSSDDGTARSPSPTGARPRRARLITRSRQTRGTGPGVHRVADGEYSPETGSTSRRADEGRSGSVSFFVRFAKLPRNGPAHDRARPATSQKISLCCHEFQFR